MFLEHHCFDCHGNDAAKGGLDLEKLDRDLSDEGTFAKWELIFDRVDKGEMPPAKVKDRPAAKELADFRASIKPQLIKAHAKAKGTVLRRLNRREYENTMNDLFGTSLELEGMLPEDGRSHEFDNVGHALGISMQHMQMYLKAAGMVLDEAIAKTTQAPKAQKIVGRYTDDKGARKFVGDQWLKLKDDSIVRFARTGYPTGMIRSARTRQEGFYRIKVHGFAYQSDKPITFSVGLTTFQRGVPKPVLDYFSFPP
ncbi:MAG: DUF1587 domain-containing protein, partial [Verrucomicrobiota bacterium]|nr:DUF1587 domain-containing protein [Verrucomicrobiota bacterium]